MSGSGISWASFQTVTIKILQAGCHSCRSTSSIKALKALLASHSCFFISPLHWHCTNHKTDVSSKFSWRLMLPLQVIFTETWSLRTCCVRGRSVSRLRTLASRGKLALSRRTPTTCPLAGTKLHQCLFQAPFGRGVRGNSPPQTHHSPHRKRLPNCVR